MPTSSRSAFQANRRGSWTFAIAWVATVGVNIGWRVSHAGFQVRIQLWLVMLAAFLFAFIFAKIGNKISNTINNHDKRRVMVDICINTLIASALWPIVYSVATWISVLFWLGPSQFLQAIQTTPFWAVYIFFPKLIVYYVIPTMFLGTLILWVSTRHNKGFNQCA